MVLRYIWSKSWYFRNTAFDFGCKWILDSLSFLEEHFYCFFGMRVGVCSKTVWFVITPIIKIQNGTIRIFVLALALHFAMNEWPFIMPSIVGQKFPISVMYLSILKPAFKLPLSFHLQLALPSHHILLLLCIVAHLSLVYVLVGIPYSNLDCFKIAVLDFQKFY